MHGLDCGDDRDLRPYQAGERRDLTGMIHAELVRGIDEIMPVAILSSDAEECLPRSDGAGVDGNSGNGPWQRAGAASLHRGCHCFDRPERPLIHATLPASAAVMASWSLNGSTCLPTIWPVSWPLPAISNTSPERKAAIDALIASRRSPISTAPGAARRIAARMAAGSSLRGLSSVTITRSASRAAIAPIIGRLPASRSPPQPNTTMRRFVA